MRGSKPGFRGSWLRDGIATGDEGMKSSRTKQGTGMAPIVAAVVGSLSVGCGARMHPRQPPEPAWCNRAVPAGTSVGQLPATETIEAQDASRSTQNESGQWVVVWASWCEPCRQELPRIGAAVELLKRRGIAVNLTLLSIDTNPEKLADFLRERPFGAVQHGRVVRILAPDGFDAWAQTAGLVSSASGLPFHLLAAPNGAIGCVHSGELLDKDVAALPSLFARLALATAP